MLPAIVDTDVLSEFLKGKRRELVQRADAYMHQHQQLTLSAITYYEIERGLLAKHATRLLAHFDALMQKSEVLNVSLPILRRAASLWAIATRQAKSHNDADLIIAATALENDLVLVTGNVRHFEWIDGLQIDTWS
jgi:tRNA(fMet)-specific endonuclease VapC